MALGIFLGAILTSISYKIYFKVGMAKYSRASLDNIMKDLLGAHDFNEILTDELLIIAYNYNG